MGALRGRGEAQEAAGGVPMSRLAARDLAGEAARSIGYRPGRSLLTVLGTVLGVGAFVATAGLASTARAQISGRFDLLKATEVVVKDAAPGPDGDILFPDDVEGRLSRLNGVRASGVMWVTDGSVRQVTARPFASEGVGATVPVVAASPGLLRAAHATYSSGRGFDAFHRSRGERVVVLGPAAARQLGVAHANAMQAVFLDGVAYLVVGVIDDVDRAAELLTAVIVPDLTVSRLYGPSTGRSQAQVLIDVQPGAAQLIGSQAALAIAPQDPGRLQVLVPPEPKSLRRAVDADSAALFYVLAAVSLAVGAVGIANTTLVAVLERRHEIGLRRAVGATRAHIAAQFMAESGALGLMGGVLGVLVGLAATVGVALARHWQPTLSPWVLVCGAPIGLCTGLVAGTYPAMKAANAHPIDSLRTG